jgi:hypothetical protein
MMVYSSFVDLYVDDVMVLSVNRRRLFQFEHLRKAPYADSVPAKIVDPQAQKPEVCMK